MKSLPVVATGGAAGLLEHLLSDQCSIAGVLYERAAGGALRCTACAHRCVIAPGSRGACGVRAHHDGRLKVPFGYVARRYVRPVETNTVFHVMPGAKALTFGLYGCDLRCPYCHNHRLSQALRDGVEGEVPVVISAKELVAEAVRAGCKVICAAYNEPMISAEWIHAVFSWARRQGLVTVLVSDGHSTPGALRYMRAVTDVFRVDLKAATEESYKKLGGRLQPVLDSITLAHKLGYWVEVVTLIVPGFNQEPAQVANIGSALREINPAIPWHLNAFVPRYKLRDEAPASAAFLALAAGAAYVAGSRFVYVGNTTECVELAHTRCPECHTTLVHRYDYATEQNTLSSSHTSTLSFCKQCGTPIPGLWRCGPKLNKGATQASTPGYRMRARGKALRARLR